MIRRPPRSTLSSSSAASDVYKRQGEATARVLAAEGAAVALLARRAGRIEGLAAEITAAGGKAVACVADVQDRDAVLRAADTVGAALGPVHILVNNAGVMLLSPFDAGVVDEYVHRTCL